MNPTFKRRFPTYMTGLMIGLAVFLVTNSLKKAFAPKFLESTETRETIGVGEGGSVRLRYAQEPGYKLIPGFPTYLKIVPLQSAVAPSLMQLGYRELTEKEILLGPFPKPGHYQLEAEFFICDKPGDATCVKRRMLMVILVEGRAPAEAPLDLDLEAMLKAGLATQPAEAATPVPSQNK